MEQRSRPWIVDERQEHHSLISLASDYIPRHPFRADDEWPDKARDEGGNARQIVDVVLGDKRELAAHFSRWMTRIAEAHIAPARDRQEMFAATYGGKPALFMAGNQDWNGKQAGGSCREGCNAFNARSYCT